MYTVGFVPFNGESNNFMGYCNVVADDKYRMSSISVLKSDNTESGIYLSMPAYFTGKKDENDKPVFKDYYYPLDSEFRKTLTDAVKRSMDIGEVVEFCRDEKVDYSVKVRPVIKDTSSNDTGLRANVTVYISRGIPDKKADIVIDSYHIREILSGDKAGKLFIAAPSKKNKHGDYNDVCFPVTKEFRDELFGQIMDTYQKELDKLTAKAQNAASMKVSDADASDVIAK